MSGYDDCKSLAIELLLDEEVEGRDRNERWLCVCGTGQSTARGGGACHSCKEVAGTLSKLWIARAYIHGRDTHFPWQATNLPSTRDPEERRSLAHAAKSCCIFTRNLFVRSLCEAVVHVSLVFLFVNSVPFDVAPKPAVPSSIRCGPSERVDKQV